jgi:thiamine pyrophosphate-dependent acetolactate synthase large subunit-like protein
VIVNSAPELIERGAFVKELLADGGSLLVVCGLGFVGSDVAAAGDRPLNFYIHGAMGSAASVGLGLALARKDRRVLVLTGDGELMMNVGALATIAAQRPVNLAIVVLDNERLGATGSQRSLTSHGADIAGIARACGFADATTVRSWTQVPDAIKRARTGEGPFLAVIKVTRERVPAAVPLWDGVELKARFRSALRD